MAKKKDKSIPASQYRTLYTAEEYQQRRNNEQQTGTRYTAEEYRQRRENEKREQERAEALRREQATRQNQAYGIATGNLNGIYNSAKTTEAFKKNNAANSALMGTYAGTYVAGKNNEGYLDYLLHGKKEQKDRLEVNKGKWVTQNQGLNRSSGKQDRDAAAGMIGNAAGIKRAGTVTDNKTYTGNNAIEEEEIDADDFERMLQDREAGNQQVPVKNMLDRPFNELTMEDQKKDPNSKINKHLAEKARLTADRESHLNIVPDEYEGTFHNENEQFHNYVEMDKTEQEVQDFVRGIEMGVYDDVALANYDYDYMSDRGLQLAWNEFDRLEKEAIRRADEAEAQDMNYDENLEIIEKAYYEIEFYKEQKRNIEGAQNRRKEYADLNSIETDGGYEWNPEEYDRGQGNYDWGNIDNIVSFINGGEAYEFYLKSERYNRYAQTGEYDENWFPEVNRKFNNAMMMLPEEKEILTQLYMDDVANGREPTQAKAYLEGLQPYLNMRYRRYEQEYNEEFASVLPVLSVGMDIGSSVMAPVQLIGTAIGAATGDKGITDPNSGWYFWQRFSEDIENKQARDLGDNGAFYYRAFMSGAKNMARSSATMGLGGLQMAADLLMFASECFMTDFRQQLDYTNGDVGRAAKHAAVEAGNETLWEIIPTEARLGTSASAWLYLGNNLFSEIAEEFLGSRIGPRMQALFGNTNEWELRAGQILYEGGYTDENGNWVKLPDDDLKAALDQMSREWWNETVTAMESAAISTGGSMGYYGLNNSLQTNRTGRTAIRSGIDVKSMDTETVAGKEWENRLRLVEAGEKMAPGTKSYQKAAQIRKDLESGKKVSYRDYGNLVRTIMSETTENIQSIVQEEAGRVFEQDLQGMGVKGKQLDELRDSAVRLVAGTYTQEDIRAMVKNKALQDVIKMYSMEDKYEPTRESVKTKIETPASVRDVVDSLMNPVQEGPNKFDGLTKDATVATQEELESADGERTNNYAEAIVQGTISDITGITVNKVKDKPAQITITTADGRTVDASEAQAVNINVAKIIALAQKDGGRTTSTKMLNTLLKFAETTDNMPEMMREAQKIRWAVIMDRATPKTSLSQNVAAEILQGAREDFEAAENERLKNNVDLKPGQGRARFGDAEYGTKEFNDALKGLNSYQRREAQIVAKMAKSAGLDLEIINDPEMDATFGQYAGGARIMVNLAGTNSAGSYHSIVVSLGHEITHMLEENSREGYAALRKYVLNTLEGRGFNLQQRIQDKMDTYEHYNKNLDIYGAIYEVVAEGCDQILTSREAIQTLMKDDPTLYNRIQRAVYRLTTQIRNAMASITGSASYEAKALMDKVDEIAKLWSKAFEEVKGVKGTAEAGGTAYSFRDSNGKELTITQDQLEANRKAVHDSEVTFVITKEDYNSILKGNFVEEGYKVLTKDGTTATNKVIGTVELAKSGLRHIAGRGNVAYVKAMTIPAIRYTIENGEIVHIDNSGHKGHDSVVISAKVKTPTGNYYVGVLVSQDHPGTRGQTNRYSFHAALMINENIAAMDSAEQESVELPKGYGNVPIHSILHYIANGKWSNDQGQLSVRDDSYMAAVERGDMETAQQMVDEAAEEAMPDSKMRTKNGKLRKLYHGTNSDTFTVFDHGTIGMASGDSGYFGKGFYFAYTKGEAGYYGKNVMEAFLNITNPYNFQQELYYLDGERTYDYNAGRAVFVTNFAEKFPELANEHKVTVWDRETGERKELTYKEFADQFRDIIKNKKFTVEKLDRDGTTEWKAFADKRVESYTNEDGKTFKWNEWGYQKSYYSEEDARNQLTNAYEYMANNVYDGIEIQNPTIVIMETNFSDAVQNRGYDGIIQSEEGDEAVVFNSNQIKLADAVTRDDNGEVIPPRERFNKENPDIRYSVRDEEIRNEDGDVLAEEFAPDSITKYSLRTWEQTDIAELTKQLIERGFKKKDVTKWIRDVNGIAKMIADNRDRLDYEATSGRMLKNNQEYIKTLDASTLCAKRLLYQGIYNEIQHMLPDTPLMPEDLIRLINMMKKRGLVTPCGICYVESRRRMLGKYASEWLKNYDGEYKPTLEEVTTTDGLEALRNEPEGSAKRQAYDDFVAAMNAKGSANPKVVQLRTDYKPGEIRDMTASQVQKVKDIGGLRVQSFSDFEVVHMIDMMQAVLDMAAMDLTSQAYTKVPEFAWVFGGTGIKINLSLIGKGTGVDADGNLLFDDVEGMPFEKAMELRRAYSKNVGTILVGMNDEHIIAAMGSDDIDFIIPFHKSGWSKREMGQVIGMASYKDYTRFQNEKLIAGKKANGRGYQTIPNKKSKISNLTPVGKEGYWQFKKDGIWNAENYLKKCAEQHRMPKFANFLIDNGDGSFRLPTEQEAAESKRMANIRKGYWKLLIDFKMYDNEGNGAKQQEVRPDFNMEKAQEILDNYEGGANKLPSNHALAKEFVDDYRKTHRNVRVNRQLADSEGSLSVRDDTEAQLRQEYDEARKKYEDLRDKISGLKGELNELNEKIRKAKEEDLDALAEEAQAWDERTGYGRISKELQEAERAERAARKALEEYSDKLDVEEEQEKIRKSGKSEADWRRDRAVEQYGYTTDYREAGYLLPNGKMLNFTGSKGQHYGMRGNDHRDIGIIYASGKMQGSPAMLAFMNDGNIRVMAETPGVDISTAHEPTTAQYNMIRNMAYRFEREEYFSVDLTDERGNNVGSFEYDGKINPSRVVNDIRDYFRTGKVREQSLTSMFHESGQFSIRDEMDFDVKHWMMSVNENSLQTEAEKVLLRQFKDLNMKEQLYRLREEDYRKRIKVLESRGEENLDKDAKYELQGLRVRLANATKIKEQTQEEMGRITSSEGYGRMMRDQNRIFNDFMYGRTQAEVTDAVERLEKSSREIEKIIRENQAAVSEMEKSEVIQRLKKALGKTTIDQAAADLKKAFHSTWTRSEIKTYLEPILVKLANGESIESDVETLAGILIESDSRNTYENLSALRGLTIRVGRGMLKELRAQNSSIKEIRARLAGTGITVVAAKEIKNEFGDTIGHESSTLEQDIESLREEYPGMPEFGNDKDALWNFVAWVEGMKRQSGAQEFYDERLAEAMATIMQKVIGTASGIYIPAEARAQAQVLELVEYVKTLQARTEAAERTLEQLAQRAGQLHTEGLKAAGMANTLTTNVNEALEYFNTTAKLAVAQAKQNRQNQIIDQLKSDFAKKMAKSNEEWRNLIERDRNAREQAEKNRKYRNQIRTVLKRAYNKLRSPKGMDNVPEYMQGLARELIGTFVDNDLAGGMRFTDSPREALQEIRRVLDAWDAESGKFNLADLNDAEEVVATIINQDLMTIYDGIAAINGEVRGKNKLDTLQQRGAILQQIQEATSEIWSAIRAENTVQVQKRRIAVEDQAYKIATAMGNRQAREWTGKAGNAIHAMRKAIVSGNMTPEYFFRALKNAGLTDLWENYHEAENRNGLELAKAKAKLAEIAEKYGYETWDTEQKVTLTLASGHQVKMTVGQLMSLYATWKREMTLGPDISQHLAGGGFFAEQDTRDGILGREVMEKRAHRISVTKDSDGNITGSPDMAMVESMLTQEQVDFVNEVVAFMSNDMSELGNEASMAAYGIKLYKEGYYFPFQMWDGVRSRKSNDSGSAAAAQDRAFHPSFSKSRKHGANNALVIGDFMRTVTDHVAGMINYATMGLANESLQKTLNTQLKEEYGPDEINKRNIWAMMEEAYGRDAVQYLRELQQQLNGGAVRTNKTFADKAISLFRKNAVAGSLSVAFQQPLSYIRAAMMISPRYLTRALAREYWQGSYKELMAHSGVAVIKDMGRFDMNFGQSARDYLTPDGKESRGRRIWNGITETATVLPTLMDRWTWTRMWVAVKAEQHALHPEMDMKSDEFLDLCGVRFNDIMRRTQVYDSTLVKSANMRSDHWYIKSLTSFMAEPTVTMNVLADAVRSAVQHEEGSGRLVRYAAGTFVVSAVMQALIKALFSSGRTPDEKKTWAENFLYRFGGNLISEMDPLQLIPGYSDLITLMKDGKLNDDAMGAIGKIWTSTKGVADLLLGNKEFSHRNLEDSIGQLVQLFTGLPAKNIMRDGRAMYNLLSEWTVGNPAYAQRANSGAVIRGQFTESLVNADNLIGLIIKELGEAGYETNNAAYYERIYQAKKEGRDEDAQNMIDYLLLGKGVKQSAIDNGVKKAAKADEDASVSEKAEFMMDEGADAGDYIKEQLKNGEIDAKEATGLLKKQYPDKSDDEIFWMVDRIEYFKETGNEVSGQYYRFYDAMDSNKATDIKREVKAMLAHGMKPENIKKQITTKYKPLYLAADNKGKTKIRDEIHKAYKALGYSAEDADKVINKWK